MTGVNFVIWGSSYPLEVISSVCHSILLISRECSPLGVNKGVDIPPRGQILPLGPSSPLRARGEIKNGPQGGAEDRVLAGEDAAKVAGNASLWPQPVSEASRGQRPQ
jgi:hypothetical protein